MPPAGGEGAMWQLTRGLLPLLSMQAWSPHWDQLPLLWEWNLVKVSQWVLRESSPKGRNVTKTSMRQGQVESPAAPPQ